MIQIKRKGGAFGRNHLHNYFAGYCETYSDDPDTWLDGNLAIDPALHPFISNFYAKVEKPCVKLHSVPARLPVTQTANKDTIIIGFSGGKDCVATALLCKAAGLKPILYHLYGINRTYKKEREHAKQLADMLAMPYVEHSVEITGHQHYPDHPFKNQLILCNMVDYGVTKGVSLYALGNHDYETLAGGNVAIEFSDSGEQIRIFDQFVKQFVPQYQRQNWLRDNTHAITTVIEADPSLLAACSSCITPVYRRPMMRKYITQHYGAAVLWPNRCGYCYKCTREYMILSKAGVLPYVDGMYQHCEHIQKHKVPTLYI